jgi:hypothetical protein
MTNREIEFALGKENVRTKIINMGLKPRLTKEEQLKAFWEPIYKKHGLDYDKIYPQNGEKGDDSWAKSDGISQMKNARELLRKKEQ